MALNTLLGAVTPEALQKLPGKVRNPDRVSQHIDAFAMRLQGVSFRGIQEHFGWKSLSTAQNSVMRGELLAKDLGLDGEKIRLKLANFFDELTDISLAQVKKQVEEGQVCLVTDNQGNQTITHRRGVDPRLLGEAGRGAIRFAEFVGIMSRAPEQNTQTTLINLAAPKDGANFSDRWDKPVEASADPAVAAEPVAGEATIAVKSTTVS